MQLMKLFQSDLTISPVKVFSILEERGLVERHHIHGFIEGIFNNVSLTIKSKKNYMLLVHKKIEKLSGSERVQTNFYVPFLKEHKVYKYFYPHLLDLYF